MDDSEVKQAFLVAFNAVLGNKAAILAGYREIMDTITDTTALEDEHEALTRESEVIAGLIRQCVDENAHTALNQEDVQKRYDGLMTRMDATGRRRAEIETERMGRTAKRARMQAYMDTLASRDSLVKAFDEELWYSTVEHVRVSKARGAAFTFKDGTEYAVLKEQWKV